MKLNCPYKLILGFFLLTATFFSSGPQPARAASITVAAFELNGSAGTEITVNATTNDTDIETVSLSRGSGITPAALANSYSATAFVVGGL